MTIKLYWDEDWNGCQFPLPYNGSGTCFDIEVKSNVHQIGIYKTGQDWDTFISATVESSLGIRHSWVPMCEDLSKDGIIKSIKILLCGIVEDYLGATNLHGIKGVVL